MPYTEYQQNALQALDLELADFSKTLNADPAAYDQYVTTARNKLLNEAMEQKRAAFAKTSTDLYRYMDMEHNAQMYSVRSGEVQAMQQSMDAGKAAAAGASQADVDSTRRQAEINEWYYGSKMEALFFLQLLLMALSLGLIMLFGLRWGVVQPGVAAVVVGIAYAVALGVGLYRWRYTTYVRDRRFWNKRKFGEDEEGESAPVSKCGPLVVNLNDVLPPALTKCAEDVYDAVGRMDKALQEEVKSAEAPLPSAGVSLCGAPTR